MSIFTFYVFNYFLIIFKISILRHSFLGVVVIEPYFGDVLSRHKGPNDAIPIKSYSLSIG